MTVGTALGRRPSHLAEGVAERRPPHSRRKRRLATPYLLLAPALAMYVVFTVYPIYRQFDISFFNWHVFPGSTSPFVGWSNYSAIFHDPEIKTASFNTLLYIVVTVPAQMAIGLFAAAVLTDHLPGSTFWRAVIYVPVVTSWVVVSYVFSYICNAQGGLANEIISVFSGHTVRIDWLAHTWTANGVIWLLGVWKGVGWSFMIFLAALDGVNREILEAARVDGAKEWRVWRHVILPSLRSSIAFVLVLLIIGAATVFTQIYLLTTGGPYGSTQVLFTYAYQQAFVNFEFGYAAAIASMMALMLFGLSIAEIRLLSPGEE